MADSRNIPAMFGRVYTAAPPEVFWDMYENDSSFDEASQRQIDREMNFDLDPFADLMGTDPMDDEFAVEKAIYQEGIRARNNQDVGGIETPYGLGLEEDALEIITAEYPGIKAMAGVDLDEVDALFTEAELYASAFDPNIENMLDNVQARAEKEGSLDQLPLVHDAIGSELEAGMSLGFPGSMGQTSAYTSPLQLDEDPGSFASGLIDKTGELFSGINPFEVETVYAEGQPEITGDEMTSDLGEEKELFKEYQKQQVTAPMQMTFDDWKIAKDPELDELLIPTPREGYNANPPDVAEEIAINLADGTIGSVDIVREWMGTKDWKRNNPYRQAIEAEIILREQDLRTQQEAVGILQADAARMDEFDPWMTEAIDAPPLPTGEAGTRGSITGLMNDNTWDPEDEITDRARRKDLEQRLLNQGLNVQLQANNPTDPLVQNPETKGTTILPPVGQPGASPNNVLEVTIDGKTYTANTLEGGLVLNYYNQGYSEEEALRLARQELEGFSGTPGSPPQTIGDREVEQPGRADAAAREAKARAATKETDIAAATAGIDLDLDATYQTNLRKVFYTAAWAQPQGTAAVNQDGLARTFNLTQNLFLLFNGADVFADQTAIKNAVGAKSVEGLATAKTKMEANYAGFLSKYFADPDYYTSGPAFKQKLTYVNNVLKKYRAIKGLMDPRWSPQERLDQPWIVGLYGGISDEARTNRRTLLKLDYTKGAVGTFANAIHKAIDTNMNYYITLGHDPEEVFEWFADRRLPESQSLENQAVIAIVKDKETELAKQPTTPSKGAAPQVSYGADLAGSIGPGDPFGIPGETMSLYPDSPLTPEEVLGMEAMLKKPTPDMQSKTFDEELQWELGPSRSNGSGWNPNL